MKKPLHLQMIQARRKGGPFLYIYLPLTCIFPVVAKLIDETAEIWYKGVNS
ncbi:hypothetical protein SDC9_150167 [bioreactor metagenome]|uniref:Uncharacterized protein n=1 Tax=bioreactor metagenome TaxID=1076179 RepID=A0A645ENC6_9ZZZZ